MNSQDLLYLVPPWGGDRVNDVTDVMPHGVAVNLRGGTWSVGGQHYPIGSSTRDPEESPVVIGVYLQSNPDHMREMVRTAQIVGVTSGF
ncbi:MAG: hypothetical protein AAB518_01575 [Patescibacteria group bacterium]